MTHGRDTARGPGPIGILGGTFDPIHFGHLRTGLELLERLGLREVRFVPAREPPHRAAPGTPADLRLRMVEAAVADEPRFVADGRELDRRGRSYTVDTLGGLAEEHPGVPLCLLLGMDAFLGLLEWHRWPDVLDLAHIVVAHRPGWRAPRDGPLGELVRDRLAAGPADLAASPAGRIHVEAVTQLEISATQLRAGVRAGGDPRYLVPEAVRRVIFETECYAEAQEAKG